MNVFIKTNTHTYIHTLTHIKYMNQMTRKFLIRQQIRIMKGTLCIFHSSFLSIVRGNKNWFPYVTLTKRLEKKLDGNYARMLRAILNRSWQQYPTRRQLYGHLPPITKTIQARRTRHAGHCWRSKDEIVSDVLLWTPTYGQSKAGRPAQTFTQKLCDDTGCNPEDLPKVMNDRETWRKRVRDIHASRTWWWWCIVYETKIVCVYVCIYIYIYIYIYAYSTWYSQAVTHPSTDQTRHCLTSVIGREPVFSAWYGRKHLNRTLA